MGNNSGRSITEELEDRFTLSRRFVDPSITLRQDRKDHSEYLVRQLVMFKEDEYKREVERLSEKKLIQDPHVVGLVDYLSNVEDMFCSTHHKIYAIYAYPHRNLDQQISERFFQKRRFEEKEIWSILASCILGLATLQNHNIKHQELQSQNVLLSNTGVIQVADPYCTASPNNYQRMLHSRLTKNIYLSPELCELLSKEEVVVPESINPYKSDVFTLGMIALEMGLLQYQHECYRDDFTRVHWQTIEYRIEEMGRNYSQQLKVMVELMLQPNPNDRQLWSEMQTYVKKSEPVFVQSQIVQEPIENTQQSRGNSNTVSPKKRDRQSIKLQPAQHSQSSATQQPTSQLKTHPQQQAITDVSVLERILPVQVSSVSRPKLTHGPNDSYITKVQFDENLMEVSDDETNEQENSEAIRQQGAGKPLSNKPSEASFNHNPSQKSVQPVSHNSSMGSLNPHIVVSDANSNREPISIHPRSFVKNGSTKNIGVEQVTSTQPKVDYAPTIAPTIVPAPESTFFVPSYTSSSYEPYRTYSRYEPIKTNGMDPLKPSYGMPSIPSSSFSPTFNYPQISTSYYTTSSLDWMPKGASSYTSPDYKDLFTDYTKLGIQKQNVYIPSSTLMQPMRVEQVPASEFESGLIQTKKIGDPSPYPKEVGLTGEGKPTESVISPSPIRAMMNNSYTSPMALPKESSSVEISSLRPVEVPASKQPHAITEPSNHVETPPTQLSQNRSQSVSKIVPITKEATTPIYVIDHFKHGARYEGEKVNNLRHGKGKFFYQDGGLYDGDWVRNKMQGHGKLYYKSGKIAYEGDWKDDEFCGKGILYNEFPEQMTKPFDPHDFDNMDEFWTRFEGIFNKDMKEGKGTLYFTNGDYFAGSFEKDFVNGPGLFCSEGKKLRGTWSNNKLVTELTAE